MFEHLQIYDPTERALVGALDLATAPLAWLRQLRAPASRPVARVLLMRLERIGDLLMVRDAIRSARGHWPDATIDLAVGAWNAPLAALLPEIDHVRVASASWLARGGEGQPAGAIAREAFRWRAERYDLVINFEPDPRSNFLAWLTKAPRRVGYATGGGGAWLTDAVRYEPASHVLTNARALVARAAGDAAAGAEPRAVDVSSLPPLSLPAGALADAAGMLERGASGAPGPYIGVHVSGGRPSKQWHLGRFADVARGLAERHGATIVLTGAPGDRALVDRVKADLLDVPHIDAAHDMSLPVLAALLSRLAVLVTGDTGPMHLAAAVQTPVVALFGPSDPRRYGPLASRQRVLRVQLPCSPCGQVRLPPERCRGHVPDCLDGITVDAVIQAAGELLSEVRPAPAAIPG